MRRRTKWVILGAKNDLRSHSIIWLIGKISYYVTYMPKYTCMYIYTVYNVYIDIQPASNQPFFFWHCSSDHRRGFIPCVNGCVQQEIIFGVKCLIKTVALSAWVLQSWFVAIN